MKYENIWILTFFVLVFIGLSSCKKESSSSVPVINRCADGILNGSETGIDCGGKCGPCNVQDFVYYASFDLDGINRVYGSNDTLDYDWFINGTGFSFGNEKEKFTIAIYSLTSNVTGTEIISFVGNSFDYNPITGNYFGIISLNIDSVNYSTKNPLQYNAFLNVISVIDKGLHPISNDLLYLIEGEFQCELEDDIGNIKYATNGLFKIISTKGI